MQLFPTLLQVLAPIVALVMATVLIVLRLRATKKPTNTIKILLPPLGMSTGFFMFIYPPTHIPWSWAIISFIAGTIFFAIPLIKTSKLQVIGNDVYLKHSPAFAVILVVLLIVRFSLHQYIEQYISMFQTASLFFILAFGMLLPWRLAMYMKYKKLKKKPRDLPV